MNQFKILFALIVAGTLSFTYGSNSDKLTAIIAKYEAARSYKFDKYETVENTIKYYQKEADFAKKLKNELVNVSEEGLTKSEKISKEL